MVMGFCSHEQQSQNWVRPIQAVFVIAYVCRMLSRTNLIEVVTLICLQEVRDLTSDQPSHGHVYLEVSMYSTGPVFSGVNAQCHRHRHRHRHRHHRLQAVMHSALTAAQQALSGMFLCALS